MYAKMIFDLCFFSVVRVVTLNGLNILVPFKKPLEEFFLNRHTKVLMSVLCSIYFATS